MQIDRRTALSLTGAAAIAGIMPVQGAAGLAAPFDAAAIVKAAADIIRREYIDEAEANRLADTLLANLAAGKYANQTSPRGFAAALTDELRAQTNDLHMDVFYDPKLPTADAPEVIAEDDLHPRFTGFGVQTAARLPGNIGLLKVTHFPSPPTSFIARYAAAMEMIRDTSALVLDLTINHGGGSDTLAYFISYFVKGDIELGRATFRREPPEVTRTLSIVEGPRYGEQRPIYVAISGTTFSAGEALSIKLQQLRGATLVGQRTKGGAHIGETFKLPFEFQIFVVKGKTDGRDWEGVGVPPDVPCEPGFAVRMCHRLALERTLKDTTDPKARQVLANVSAHSTENLSSFSL